MDTEEQRLQAITEMLILVRDNLFRGMSKSIQKLQARSINEVLELPNYTESPQRQWVGLTDEEILRADPRFGKSESDVNPYQILGSARDLEAKLKENT
jgi:hypothetical protein